MCEGSQAPSPLPHHHLQIIDPAIPTLEVQTDEKKVVNDFPIQCLKGSHCMGSRKRVCTVM